jgi:hypothetical protein
VTLFVNTVLYDFTNDESLIINPITPPQVYKGHTLRAELPSVARSHAENITATFQTWGPGKRFAVVPTRDGYAW